MRRSNHTVQTIAFLAALGLTAPAWANGSASSVDIDSFTGESIATITAVTHDDGAQRVAQTGQDGKVISQVASTTDPQTGIRTVTEIYEDGAKTITITNARGEEISVMQVAATPEGEAADYSDVWAEGFDEWVGAGGLTETEDSESASESATVWFYGENAGFQVGEGPKHKHNKFQLILAEMTGLEDEILDLQRRRDDLLDRAAHTEDDKEYADLVEKAQDVSNKLEKLEAVYSEFGVAAARLGVNFRNRANLGDGFGPFLGSLKINDDVSTEIGRLERQLAEIRELAEHVPIDDEETYRELMQEAEQIKARIGTLEETNGRV